MNYSVEISEPNLGRMVTLHAPTADEALYMARSWVSEPVVTKNPSPTVAELIQASKPKPLTQGVVAQGFEAFGPMGERHGSAQ